MVHSPIHSVPEEFALATPSSTNCLLYVDDVCVVSGTPASCRFLLDAIRQWLDWTRPKAEMTKRRSVGIRASTTRRVNPGVAICGESIGPVEDDGFKFLGMPVRVYRNSDTAKASLRENLKRRINLVDGIPLACHRKLRLYKDGICPRLSRHLVLEDLPIDVVDLRPLATKALKGWPPPARCADTSVLYPTTKRGGLALPCLVDRYQTLQSSCMAHFFTSRDPGVREAARLRLQEEREKVRARYNPATLVEEITSRDCRQPQSRRTLLRPRSWRRMPA